jgi:hypothetical protein
MSRLLRRNQSTNIRNSTQETVRDLSPNSKDDELSLPSGQQVLILQQPLRPAQGCTLPINARERDHRSLKNTLEMSEEDDDDDRGIFRELSASSTVVPEPFVVNTTDENSVVIEHQDHIEVR